MLLLLLAGCDPYAEWPEEGTYFPYVYTPESDLPPYADARVETETWTPEDDPGELALYIQKAALHRPSASAEELPHFDAMRSELATMKPGTTAQFVGDIMWIGENWGNFAAPAGNLLTTELRAGNLETPTDPSQSTDESALGAYAFNAPTEIYDSLPLNFLQLNNNHSLDAGNDGAAATLAEAEARAFTTTGIDHHATVGSISLLSYTWGLNVRDVDPTHEFYVVPFGHLDEEIDLSDIQADISAARSAGAESVVLLLHWGYEYEYYPDPHFMVLGRELVALGADLVVGTGPHVAQPAEICHVNAPEIVPGVGTCSLRTDDGEARTAAIFYSLGNFGTKMATTQCQAGLVASVTLAPDVSGLGWSSAATVAAENGREIQPLDTLLQDETWSTESNRLDELIGADWRE